MRLRHAAVLVVLLAIHHAPAPLRAQEGDARYLLLGGAFTAGAVVAWRAWDRAPRCNSERYTANPGNGLPISSSCGGYQTERDLLLGASVALSVGAIWAFSKAFGRSHDDSRAVLTVRKGDRPAYRLPAPVYIAPQRETRVELLRLKF